MRIVATVAALLILAGCSSGPAAPELTAEQVVTQLSQRIPTAKPGVTYTAETDPNHLLGRPGGYTSKASFVDNRIDRNETLGSSPGSVELGGSVEVFANEADAQKRKDFLKAIGPPLANEYDYLNGAILLRVSDILTPKQAAEYQTALAEVE